MSFRGLGILLLLGPTKSLAECVGNPTESCSDSWPHTGRDCSQPTSGYGSNSCFETLESFCENSSCGDNGCSCSISSRGCATTYCDYVMRCDGSPQACSNYESSFRCNSAAGCTWIPPPTTPPPVAPPTPPPTTEIPCPCVNGDNGGFCGLCLKLVAPQNCPADPTLLPTCEAGNVLEGGFCTSKYNRCGTSVHEENCPGLIQFTYDVYERLPCFGSNMSPVTPPPSPVAPPPSPVAPVPTPTTSSVPPPTPRPTPRPTVPPPTPSPISQPPPPSAPTFDPDIVLNFDILGEKGWYYPDAGELCNWTELVDYSSLECTDNDTPFGLFRARCDRDWIANTGSIECTCLQLGTCTNCVIVLDEFDGNIEYKFNVTADCDNNAGSPPPAPMPDLSGYGFPYSQDASKGWYFLPPHVHNGTDFVYTTLFSLEDCAQKCSEVKAFGGAWNTRHEECWCCLDSRGCLEPCVAEFGIDFSSQAFSEFSYCEHSYCDEEYYYNDSKDYCDNVLGFNPVACESKKGSLGSTSSSTAKPLLLVPVCLGLVVYSLYM